MVLEPCKECDGFLLHGSAETTMMMVVSGELVV
jgi:hypothetical protein